MKRVAVVLLAAFVLLTAVVVVRALMLPSKQIAPGAPAPPLSIDREAALARFRRALQFRTISYGDEKPAGPVEHDAFVAWLAETYPSQGREIAGTRALLYTWKGSDASLPPVLFMGHYDVVPVEPGTESKWEQPPFSGAVAGDFIWGRGALDDKLTVIALLEAAGLLAAEGYRPKRTIYFAFGPDEEARGVESSEIARLLAKRGVRLDAVIDEGGAIMTDAVEGAPRPVAMIGIAEKGFATVELTASGAGGHSSMPPPRTEVGAIAAAVDAVQRHPFPASVRGAAAESFQWLAPELPFARKAILSNLWLFEPLLERQAGRSNSLSAMLRTTTAPTIISGGVKDNVIPSHARAVINFRILPGDTTGAVIEHVRKSIDDPHVKVRLSGIASEPSRVSNPGAPQFRALQQTIGQVFPDTIVAPYLVLGATDSRHYAGLTDNIYRFMPVVMASADLARLHGTNERVSVRGYFEAIRFYRALIVNMGGDR